MNDIKMNIIRNYMIYLVNNDVDTSVAWQRIKETYDGLAEINLLDNNYVMAYLNMVKSYNSEDKNVISFYSFLTEYIREYKLHQLKL